MRFSLRGTVLFVPVVPDVTGIVLSLIALSCFRAGQGTFFFFFFTVEDGAESASDS